MKIFTSYYANIKNVPKEYILVSISILPPQYLTLDYHLPNFAPTKELLFEYKNNPNEKFYIDKFRKQKFNFREELKKMFSKFGADKTYVFLCYEKPQDFCHCFLISEMINDKVSENFKIEELGYEEYLPKNGRLILENDEDW